MTNSDISIIVTTKNEEQNIQNCLLSIQQNKNIAKEIIIVDNFSTDKTIKIAEKFDCKILQKGPERSAQRNYGISEASSQLILFLDCDMIIGPNLLKNYHKFLSDNLYNEIVGCYIPEIILGNSYLNRLRNYERKFYSGTPIDCSRIFFKNKFFEAGLFDENLNGPEDWDFDKRLRRTGKVVLQKFDDFNENDWDKKILNLIKLNSPRNDINNSNIFHNEKNISFFDHLKKKIYYLLEFKKYKKKWSNSDVDIKKQFGLKYRFFQVFFENKKYYHVIKNLNLFVPMIMLKLSYILLLFFNKK